MDAASGIAGLIGLAALTVQSTTKIIGFIKDMKEVPDKLQGHLRWLEWLIRLIHQFNPTISNFERAGTSIDLSLVQESLEGGLVNIQRLLTYVDIQCEGLENSTGLRRRTRKLRAVLASEEVDGQLRTIRRTLDGLDVCLANVSLQMQQESQTKNRQMQRELQSSMKQLWQLASTISADLQDVKECQQWAGATQETLPLEISRIIHSVLDRKLEEPRPQKDLTVKCLSTPNHRISPTARSKRSANVCAQKGKSIPHHKSNSLQAISVTEEVTAAPEHIVDKPRGFDKMAYSWRIQNQFASLSIRVHHQFTYKELENRTQENMTYSISIFPRHWLCNRAIQLFIQYDHIRGLSSPVTIQLRIPRIHPHSDPIVTAITSGCLETVQDLIRSGSYQPYDMVNYDNVDGPPSYNRSLLNCLRITKSWEADKEKLAVQYTQIDIIRYLIQEGAKPDTSNSPYPITDITHAWKSYSLSQKKSFEGLFESIGLLLHAGGEVTVDALVLDVLFDDVSVHDFRRILLYLLHHANSTLLLCDIQNSTRMIYLSFPPEAFMIPQQRGEELLVERFNLLLEFKCQFSTVFSSEKLPTWLLFYYKSQQAGILSLTLLLQNGFDPFEIKVEEDVEITFTLCAYTHGLLKDWFEALNDCGISIEAVARHTLERLPGVRLYPSDRKDLVQCFRGMRLFAQTQYTSFETFRTKLLQEFAKHGCYIDP